MASISDYAPGDRVFIAQADDTDTDFLGVQILDGDDDDLTLVEVLHTADIPGYTVRDRLGVPADRTAYAELTVDLLVDLRGAVVEPEHAPADDDEDPDEDDDDEGDDAP